MKVIISQPRYLPALNYLQRLYFAEKFVILDVVQRQARGWENRNKLLLPTPSWLTVPVASSSRALISEATVSENAWAAQHKKVIVYHYGNAPYFSHSLLEELYEIDNQNFSYTDTLVKLLKNICRLLSFEPCLVRASEIISTPELKTVSGPILLRRICDQLGATVYVSGPNGVDYKVSDAFDGSNIKVAYHKFNHPTYPQRLSNFFPYMGFIDALFQCGTDWLSTQIRQNPELSDK